MRTSQFNYDRLSRTMTAEASDLGVEFEPRVGTLDVVSDHTGVVLRFYLADSYPRYDGDISHWVYVPAAGGAPHNVRSLVVFND